MHQTNIYINSKTVPYGPAVPETWACPAAVQEDKFLQKKIANYLFPSHDIHGCGNIISEKNFASERSLSQKLGNIICACYIGLCIG